MNMLEYLKLSRWLRRWVPQENLVMRTKSLIYDIGELTYLIDSSGNNNHLLVISGTVYPLISVQAPIGHALADIGPFAGEAIVYIPNLAQNEGNQVFWDDIKGMIVYSSIQTDTVSRKVLAYLNEPFWSQGMVSAIDVFDFVNDRGEELSTSYAGDQYLDGVNIGANPAVSDKGLDVGPARTNVLNSAAIDYTDDTYWFYTSLSVISDGTLCGFPAYEVTSLTGVEAYHRFGNRSAILASKTYNISFYIEQGIQDTYKIRGDTGASQGFVDLDFSAKTAVATDGTAATYSSVTFEEISSGIARISFAVITTAALPRFGPSFNSTTVGLTFRIAGFQVTEGLYLFDYIPPGATHTSSAATSGGNGASLPMESYEQEPDGVDLINTVGVVVSGSGITVDGRVVTLLEAPSGGTVDFLAPGLVSGDSVEVKYEISGYVKGDITPIQYGDDNSYHILETNMANGRVTEIVQLDSAGGSGTGIFRLWNQSLATMVVTVISVQKLQDVPNYNGTSMLAGLRGKPDGVELWVDPTTDTIDENTYSTYDSETGIGRIVSDGTFVKLTISDALIASDRYLIVYQEIAKVSGSLTFSSSAPVLNLTSGSQTEEFIAGVTELYIQRTFGTPCDVTFKLSVQKLLPATCTVLSEMFMGVGGTELPEDVRIPCVSCKNSTIDLLYIADTAGVKRLVNSFDGVSYVRATLTWNRNEIHKRVVQTSTNGTQFRVGYRRFESDGTTPISAWVWSSYSAFDGSFDPLDFLRFGYSNTVPMWFRNLYMWNRGDVTEAELNAPLEVTA